jgi:hypothetical protein
MTPSGLSGDSNDAADAAAFAAAAADIRNGCCRRRCRCDATHMSASAIALSVTDMGRNQRPNCCRSRDRGYSTIAIHEGQQFAARRVKEAWRATIADTPAAHNRS